MPLSDWTQALSGQGIKLHKSLSKPHTWWHIEPVQTIFWSLCSTSSAPSIPEVRCQPACLPSERAGEIKRTLTTSKNKGLQKNRLPALVWSLDWEGIKPTSTFKHHLQEIQQRGFRGTSGKTKSPLKTGLTSELYQVAQGLVWPNFEDLWRCGFHSLFETTSHFWGGLKFHNFSYGHGRISSWWLLAPLDITLTCLYRPLCQYRIRLKLKVRHWMVWVQH